MGNERQYIESRHLENVAHVRVAAALVDLACLPVLPAGDEDQHAFPSDLERTLSQEDQALAIPQKGRDSVDSRNKPTKINESKFILLGLPSLVA